MKIGINARTFSVDEPGGAVQAAMKVTSELIETTDHEVVLFGSKDLEQKYSAEVRSTFYAESQVLGVVWERTVLPWLATDLDVLYCPNANAPLHSLPFPVVMCIHDVNAQKGMSSSLHQFYRTITVPPATQNCDAITTVSEFSKKEIGRCFDANECKIHTIYNGVDEFYFDGESSEINLPEKYFLFVGSLNPRKNIKGVIQAYRKVMDDFDVDLVLIGPENKDIFKDIEVDRVSGLHQCGFLDIAEVKYAYENAEALVFPSFYEGFGLPPLESLACGTPVIASNRGALPEILDDLAIFVNPDHPSDIASGMEQVLETDSINTQELKAHARQFDWRHVTSRLLSVLEQVANP